MLLLIVILFFILSRLISGFHETLNKSINIGCDELGTWSDFCSVLLSSGRGLELANEGWRDMLINFYRFPFLRSFSLMNACVGDRGRGR